MTAAIAAQAALTQQAIALEVLKQSMEMQQQVAEMLMQSVASVPVSAVRGTALNISA